MPIKFPLGTIPLCHTVFQYYQLPTLHCDYRKYMIHMYKDPCMLSPALHHPIMLRKSVTQSNSIAWLGARFEHLIMMYMVDGFHSTEILNAN
jgi:hypothetical protein